MGKIGQTTKKLSKHIMYFDKETDRDLINEIVEGTQLDFPDCEIIVKFNEDNKTEELSNLSPSKNCAEYWLFAKRAKGTYPSSNRNSGKWLIFADIKEIDDIWFKIKTATENGSLGGTSKVSTAKPNPNAVNKNKKVVCVSTYDYTDIDDVMRIREELRKIGINIKIPYKTDKATFKGEYQVKGKTNISTYYE